MKKAASIFLALVLTMALFGTSAMAETATQEPIKIGVLVPLTGAFAALGVDGMEGVKMAFEEIDYTIEVLQKAVTRLRAISSTYAYAPSWHVSKL